MKCNICGTELHKLNYHYVPIGPKRNGKRYCIKCMRKERIITLV